MPTNDMCGDPHYGNVKELYISYSCQGAPLEATIRERSQAMLTCYGLDQIVMRLTDKLVLPGKRVRREGLVRIPIPSGYNFCQHWFHEFSGGPQGSIDYAVERQTTSEFVMKYKVPCNGGVDVGRLLKEEGDENAQKVGKILEKELECTGAADSWVDMVTVVEVAKDGTKCPAH